MATCVSRHSFSKTLSLRRVCFAVLVATALSPMHTAIGWAAPVASGVPSTTPKGHPPSVVTVRFPQEPETLNPYAEAQSDAVIADAAIFDSLFTIDDEWDIQPALAAKLPAFGASAGSSISKDGLTWRIALRPKVKWHDGSPFTSADVKFTIQHFAVPRGASPRFRGSDDITGVDTPDPLTAVIHLRAPMPGLLELLSACPMLPDHLLSGLSDQGISAFFRAPVGTGPFAYDDWRAGTLSLKAYDGYFRGKPRLERLTFQVIADDRVALAQLQRGELSVIPSLSVRAARSLKDDQTLRLVTAPTSTLDMLMFNAASPLLSDKRVRRAIGYLAPVELAETQIYGGLWQVATSPFVGPSARTGRFAVPAYDPDKARKLLDDAGWKLGADGIRVKGGKRLSLELSTPAGNRQREQFLSLLTEEGRKAGIDFSVKLYPTSRFFAAPADGGVVDGGAFSIALFGITAGLEPDLYRMFHSTMAPPLGTNSGRYKSKTVDAQLDALSLENDPKARAEAIDATVRTVLDEAAIYPLFFWSRIDAVSPHLKGLRPAGTDGGLLWNVWEWSLEPVVTATRSQD